MYGYHTLEVHKEINAVYTVRGVETVRVKLQIYAFRSRFGSDYCNINVKCH
jgi:hypothetical protein